MLGRQLNSGHSVSKILVLVWVPPKANLETRIWVQEVHLGAEIMVRGVGVREEGRKADRGGIMCLLP